MIRRHAWQTARLQLESSMLCPPNIRRWLLHSRLGRHGQRISSRNIHTEYPQRTSSRTTEMNNRKEWSQEQPIWISTAITAKSNRKEYPREQRQRTNVETIDSAQYLCNFLWHRHFSLAEIKIVCNCMVMASVYVHIIVCTARIS